MYSILFQQGVTEYLVDTYADLTSIPNPKNTDIAYCAQATGDNPSGYYVYWNGKWEVFNKAI